MLISQPNVVGSKPTQSIILATLAQLVERQPFKLVAAGSRPACGIIFLGLELSADVSRTS